jgi:glutamate dehydrogenase/leucine dehydrogenase
MFSHPDFDAHEKVLMVEDVESGLQAIIAIHSTALGAAAGGCRACGAMRTGRRPWVMRCACRAV